MTSFTASAPLLTKKTRRRSAVAGGNGSSAARSRQQPDGYHFAFYAGESARMLVDPADRDPDPPRPGSDGRGQRPGVPPPGAPLRGRTGLLRDGLLRRDRAPERADPRLPAGRGRRASPRDPDLRVGAGGDG